MSGNNLWHVTLSECGTLGNVGLDRSSGGNRGGSNHPVWVTASAVSLSSVFPDLPTPSLPPEQLNIHLTTQEELPVTLVMRLVEPTGRAVAKLARLVPVAYPDGPIRLRIPTSANRAANHSLELSTHARASLFRIGGGGVRSECVARSGAPRLAFTRSLHSSQPARDVFFVTVPEFKETLLTITRVTLVALPLAWRWGAFRRFPSGARTLIWVPLASLMVVVGLGLQQSPKTARWRLLLMSKQPLRVECRQVRLKT